MHPNANTIENQRLRKAAIERRRIREEEPFPRALAPDGPDESLFARLRERKGWTDDYMAEINDPSYDTLVDMDAMVAALHAVKQSGEKIIVLPDFDMDGITSGTLGWAGLNELGLDAELYIPDFRRGHDVTPEAVQEAHEQFPDATTIITCDGGINSLEGIQRGRDLGLTMLVTDHHVELPPGNNAHIAVNPQRMGETYSHPSICGAFVFYQVLMAYAAEHEPHLLGDIATLKLFAGMGTVSDVMPLLNENRQLVMDSLSIARLLYVPIPSWDLVAEYDIEDSILMSLLRSRNDHAPEFISVFEGFAICLKALRAHGKLKQVSDIDEGFYGFYMAPAFNSIRRINGEMANAFGVFTANSPDEKLACMERIIEGNELRKELSERCAEELMITDQPWAPWAYVSRAPLGMLGLIANTMMNETGRPVIVIAHSDDPTAKRAGSARSPSWFPIIDTMAEKGFTAVGHQNACGVRMADQTELEAFIDHMSTRAEEIYEEVSRDGSLAKAMAPDMVLGPGEDCDATLDDVEALLHFTKGIDMFRPFGQGFPRPEFELIVDLSQCHISTLGEDETHLKIILPSGMKLLWWNEADRLADLEDMAESPIPGEASIRFTADLSTNTFMGNTSLQATIAGVIKDDEQDEDQP